MTLGDGLVEGCSQTLRRRPRKCPLAVQSDCELVHCLRLKTVHLPPFLRNHRYSIANSPPPHVVPSTTMELVNASANSVNDAPAKGANDGTGRHSVAWHGQLTDQLACRHRPAGSLSGAVLRRTEEPLCQSPAVDQDDRRDRGRSREVLKGKQVPAVSGSTIADLPSGLRALWLPGAAKRRRRVPRVGTQCPASLPHRRLQRLEPRFASYEQERVWRV